MNFFKKTNIFFPFLVRCLWTHNLSSDWHFGTEFVCSPRLVNSPQPTMKHLQLPGGWLPEIHFPSCEGNTGWESYFLHFNLLFPLPLAGFEITLAIVVNAPDARWHTLISKEISFFFFWCRWKLIVLRDRSVFQMETSAQRDFSLWLKRLKPAKHLCNPLSNPRGVSSH